MWYGRYTLSHTGILPVLQASSTPPPVSSSSLESLDSFPSLLLHRPLLLFPGNRGRKKQPLHLDWGGEIYGVLQHFICQQWCRDTNHLSSLFIVGSAFFTTNYYLHSFCFWVFFPLCKLMGCLWWLTKLWMWLLFVSLADFSGFCMMVRITLWGVLCKACYMSSYQLSTMSPSCLPSTDYNA